MGLAATAFSVVTSALRERSLTKLDTAYRNAAHNAQVAETQAAALRSALAEGMRSRLMQIEEYLELTDKPGVRISLYSHRPNEHVLIRRARFSRSPRLEDQTRGRVRIADDNGLLGRALHAAQPVRADVTFDRSVGASPRQIVRQAWMVNEGGLTAQQARDLFMQTETYLLGPTVDTSNGRTVGMLVCEFETKSHAPSMAQFKRCLSARGRDLAVALGAIEDAMVPASVSAPRPGGHGGTGQNSQSS